jgi:hypothetical protein
MSPTARAALLLVPVLAACHATRTPVLWRDPAYQGRIQKLVVAVAVEGPMRSAAEDAFVSNMPKGTQAVQSYQLQFTPEMAKDREAARARLVALRDEGYEGALVARVADSIITEESKIAPVGTQTMYDYWGYAWTSYTMGVVTESHTTLVVETRLFDLRTERAVWAAATEAFDQTRSVDAVRKIVDEVSGRLRSANVVGAK